MMITRYVLPMRIWRFIISKSTIVKDFKPIVTNKTKEKVLKISTNSAKSDLDRKIELCKTFLTKFVRVRVVVEQTKGDMNSAKIMDFAQNNVADKISQSLFKEMTQLKMQNDSTVSFTIFPHNKS